MKVKALKLKDDYYGNQWFDEIVDRWEYREFTKDKRWRTGWISMDCALYNTDDDRVYLGITSFDADITKAYNRKTGEFEDLGFKKISNPYDAKFHRSLVKRKADGCIYGAIALLHCSDRQWEAPGGAIVKYDPKSNDISKTVIPLPHIYIQATAIDQQRDILYCQCFPPEYLLSYNLKNGEVKNLGLVGTGIAGMTQGENIQVDNNGNLWGACSLTRAWQSEPGVDARRLLKVPAGTEKLKFLKTGLPKKDGSYGYERIEGIFNLGDGYMYASGGNGSIYRIDTETENVQYLFTPIADRRSRLSSMTTSLDGYAYAVVGRDGKCELLRFDYKNTKYELLGNLVDESGDTCWQIHDLVASDDGTLYACENDNPYRSSYLWEISL